MTNNDVSTNETKRWPDYRAVWRWHFYASLFAIPFVVVLSISGAIYLFKVEIEAWYDRPIDNLVHNASPAPISEQVKAALAVSEGAVPTGYELPPSPQSAGRVLVQANGEGLRVYVHPETLAILRVIPEKDRFMRQMAKLHGELWMGDWGSHVVELASCWTIIMLLTGLWLWWPRNSKNWGGILYPRLWHGTKIFWRDWHSVTGFWISGCALFLLVSGLPWAKFWGDYFKTVRRITGTSVAQQDWANGSQPQKSPGNASNAGKESSNEHAGHQPRGRGQRHRKTPDDLTDFDRVVAAVVPLQLDPPVIVSPPLSGRGDWTAKSNTPNRPRRVDLMINGTTGEIVSRKTFWDRHVIDQIVGIGIAAHEGRLFGWPNQLLGLLTALGLVLLSFSGIIMWWRRRKSGTLGAPEPALSPRFSASLVALVVALGIYLPFFGGTLVLVLLVEHLILRRVPRVRQWFGLQPAVVAASQVAQVDL